MRKYSCKTCGAELYFDAATQKLKCAYCDSEFDPSEFDDEADTGEEKQHKEEQPDSKVEREVSEYDKATDDSEGELVVYKCAHCGAEIITSKNTVATTCVYCNRAVTLEGNLKGTLKPDYVIPFTKQKEDVEAAYRKMCKQTFLAPKLFREESTIKKLKGVYIPFWMYSMKADANLRAKGLNVRVWRSGDIEYTETSTYDVEEHAKGDFDKIPEDALTKMDNQLMDSLEPFDYKELKPFTPAYLAGYYTERFDEDAKTNESRAKERARASLHSQMMQKIGTYNTVNVVSEDVKFYEEKAEYAMLPVWMMYTQYKGKDYVFGMNGQTGKMVGHMPKDIGKAVRITAGVFLGSQVLMMLFRVIGGLL